MSVVVAVSVTMLVIGGMVALIVHLVKGSHAQITNRRARFDDLVAALGRGAPIERHGRRFDLHYTSASRGVPESITFEIHGGAADDRIRSEREAYRRPATPVVLDRHVVRLRPETALDRTGKRLGLNREAQTGDVEFDARVYIETEAPDAWVREVFAVRETRRAVLDLFDRRLVCVWLNASATASVSAQQNSPRDDHLTPGHFDAIAAILDRLAGGLPRFRSETVRVGLSAGAKLMAASVLGAVGAIPWAMAAARLWPPADDTLTLVGLGGGLVAWIVAIPIVGRIVRGHFDALREFVIVLVAALVGLPLVAVSLLKTVNGALDGSAPTTHRVRVLGAQASRGKTTTYYARVEPWRPGETPRQLQVTAAVYFAVASNGMLAVTTHRGTLGWEWISEIEALSPR